MARSRTHPTTTIGLKAHKVSTPKTQFSDFLVSHSADPTRPHECCAIRCGKQPRALTCRDNGQCTLLSSRPCRASTPSSNQNQGRPGMSARRGRRHPGKALQEFSRSLALDSHHGRPGVPFPRARAPGRSLPLHDPRRDDGDPGTRLRSRGDAAGGAGRAAHRTVRRPDDVHRDADHPDFASFDLSRQRTGVKAGSICPVEVMKRCVEDMKMAEVSIAYAR